MFFQSAVKTGVGASNVFNGDHVFTGVSERVIADCGRINEIVHRFVGQGIYAIHIESWHFLPSNV
jgi:hypothetical protein